MTLHCIKTGRYWPCITAGQARSMAASLGLKDWTFCPAGIAPPSMSETISEMRARPRHAVTRGIE